MMRQNLLRFRQRQERDLYTYVTSDLPMDNNLTFSKVCCHKLWAWTAPSIFYWRCWGPIEWRLSCVGGRFGANCWSSAHGDGGWGKCLGSRKENHRLLELGAFAGSWLIGPKFFSQDTVHLLWRTCVAFLSPQGNPCPNYQKIDQYVV